jgi:hypothetical protein
MENNALIPVYHFCVTHEIEISFIESLQQYGLVEITTIENKNYLNENQLREVEKMVRLHYDLDINLEGIEAISHLLEKLAETEARNKQLQNRLNLYETRRGDY